MMFLEARACASYLLLALKNASIFFLVVSPLTEREEKVLKKRLLTTPSPAKVTKLRERWFFEILISVLRVYLIEN